MRLLKLLLHRVRPLWQATEPTLLPTFRTAFIELMHAHGLLGQVKCRDDDIPGQQRRFTIARIVEHENDLHLVLPLPFVEALRLSYATTSLVAPLVTSS